MCIDRVLGHSKNSVNRLQFLNEIGLIPEPLLVSKNTEEQVRPIVLEFLADDRRYGHLTGSKDAISPDDMYPANDAWTRIREFAKNYPENFDDGGAAFDGGPNNLAAFEMPGKTRLIEVFQYFRFSAESTI